MGIKPQADQGAGLYGLGLSADVPFNGRSDLKKNGQCLDWLDRNKAPAMPIAGGITSISPAASKLTRFEPIIVWTGLIGQAYLDAYEILGDEQFLKIAESICAWIWTSLAKPRRPGRA
ncbi:MAG: hypothetical protein MZU79_06870 [Anaerotruncus sp.]|nr:hypothetical protein [Anaerotruncus sp.]